MTHDSWVVSELTIWHEFETPSQRKASCDIKRYCIQRQVRLKAWRAKITGFYLSLLASWGIAVSTVSSYDNFETADTFLTHACTHILSDVACVPTSSPHTHKRQRGDLLPGHCLLWYFQLPSAVRHFSQISTTHTCRRGVVCRLFVSARVLKLQLATHPPTIKKLLKLRQPKRECVLITLSHNIRQ